MEHTVTDSGLIEKRRSPGKYRKPFPDRDGYLKLTTNRNGVTYNFNVSRIIWEAFNGLIPDDMVVDHINNDRTDNRLDNLQLLTVQQNAEKGSAKLWKFVSPEGETVEVYNLKKFCRDNGLHASHMAYVFHEKPHYHRHKGWTKYVEKSTTYGDGPRALRQRCFR